MNYPSKPSLQPQHRKITEAPPEYPATSTAADFTKQHLPGVIETNSFPDKSDEEKARLNKALPAINAGKAQVIVLCPRGKSGAKNSYDYLQSKGVVENRLRILEGGIADWPYAEMLVKGR